MHTIVLSVGRLGKHALFGVGPAKRGGYVDRSRDKHGEGYEERERGES